VLAEVEGGHERYPHDPGFGPVSYGHRDLRGVRESQGRD
jgi:hypothetical protein